MSDQRNGGIDWTDETWNPVRGCTRVSPGCENCYAERMAARFSGPGMPYEGLARIGPNGGRWTGKVALVEKHLADPLRWKRPRRVFVNSMSDLFHDGLADEDIERVFAVMALAPQHTFQVLTKRPARMLKWFTTLGGLEDRRTCVARAAEHIGDVIWDARGSVASNYFGCAGGPPKPDDLKKRRAWPGWPLTNVWLGVTAEDQQRADERVPLLLQAPAAVRFVSVEPQLGRVVLDNYLRPIFASPNRLDWVICGAESGPGARPFNLDWARSLRDQCGVAGVAFFGKQDADARGRKLPLLLNGATTKEFP